MHLRFQQQLDLKFYFLMLVVDHHKHWRNVVFPQTNWFRENLFTFLNKFLALIAQATSIFKSHLTFSVVFVIVNPRFALSLSIKPLPLKVSTAVQHILPLKFSLSVLNSSLASSLPLSTEILLRSQKTQSDTEIFFNSEIFLFGIDDTRIW